MWTRRKWLVTSLGGGLLLGTGSWLTAWWEDQPQRDDPYDYQFLEEPDQALVLALAEVMLPHLPEPDQLWAVVQGVDLAILGLGPATQDELRQLFDLLGLPLLRRLAAGVRLPWPQAGPKAIQGFLQSWRYSRLSLLRASYQGLRDLVMASYYASSDSWAGVGYAGPPVLKGVQHGA